MIVRPRPGLWKLFFVMQGSIVPGIAPQILGFLAWGAAVVGAARLLDWEIGAYGVAPFALIGVALSLYLGFRNNAAYDRWWEARKLWGQLVYDIRNLSRAVMALVPDGQARPMLMEALAFCHFLRGQLRGVDVAGQAEAFAGEAATAASAAANPADATIRSMGARIAGLKREGAIGDIDFRILDERLATIAALQAGCERIAGTPLPFAYSLLLQRSAYLFCAMLPFALAGTAGWATPVFTAFIAYCFFGLDALTQELEDPFGPEANDLALDALCRTCEISVFEALGETPPEPMAPDRYYYS